MGDGGGTRLAAWRGHGRGEATAVGYRKYLQDNFDGIRQLHQQGRITSNRQTTGKPSPA